MIVRNWLFSIFLRDSYEKRVVGTSLKSEIFFHRFSLLYVRNHTATKCKRVRHSVPRRPIDFNVLEATPTHCKGCRPFEPRQIKWQLVIIHPECIKEPPLKQGVSGYNGPCRWRGTPWSRRKRKMEVGGEGMEKGWNDCCDEPEKTCIVPELTVRYTLSCYCFLLAREGLKRAPFSNYLRVKSALSRWPLDEREEGRMWGMFV